MVNVAQAPPGLPQLDESQFPSVVKLKDIDTRHADWKLNAEQRTHVGLMYEGGRAIRDAAELFLVQRPVEDAGVYQHRLRQFCYENHLGTGLGWHEAEMFKDEPAIDIHVGESADTKPSEDQTAFYTRFMANCDRKGTGLIDKYRKVFTDLLLHADTWILTDFPVSVRPVSSMKDQLDRNLLDPITTVLPAKDVINWEYDEDGNLAWAVVHSKVRTQQMLGSQKTVDRWYCYDTLTYRVYERECKEELTSPDDSTQVAQLVSVGYHALATYGQVPLQRVQLPAGWWMGNRAYLAAMEHINVSNALKWSLFMAALAVPVVISDDEIKGMSSSETGYIHLGVGSDYKFAEPSGTCWKHLADRADSLKQEIYRQMYLVAQSRDTSATAGAASGVSKEQDMQPSHDVLNGLGDLLRKSLVETMRRVARARDQVLSKVDAGLVFSVRGFAFEEAITQQEVATLSGLHDLAVPSVQFEKLVDKSVVDKTFPDLQPEIRAAIHQEIDNAPTRAEIAKQAAEEEAARMSSRFASGLAA